MIDTEVTERYCGVISASIKRLSANQRVRRNLPGSGRLRMDRQLPFLCVTLDEREPGTRDLVTTQAAYLFASGSQSHRVGIENLAAAIGDLMLEHFGTFLFLQIYEDSTLSDGENGPQFVIGCDGAMQIPSTLDTLENALSSVHVGGIAATVDRSNNRNDCDVNKMFPEGFPKSTGAACVVRIGVSPIYRDLSSGLVYPIALMSLRTQLATAIRQTVAEFTGNRANPGQPLPNSFGPSSMVRAVCKVDQQLCDVAASYDFLLQVTPTNSVAAKAMYMEGDSGKLPDFRYRHLPYHPSLLKRKLFAIEIERIEDPTLAYLLWEKQEEMDRQLSLLRDLHDSELRPHGLTPVTESLSGSLQLYGRPDQDLIELANELLRRSVSRHATQRDDVASYFNGEELADAARKEIQIYQSKTDGFDAAVELSDTIASGIMVSGDRLMISPRVRIPQQRVAPLLHHEIGTHLLTYFNGQAQRLRQLKTGLAGYDELQEGLAVLAEYLVGGLSIQRIRTLAGRVLAVHAMVSGQSFADVATLLSQQHGFTSNQAFTITLRVFRGGGLTKDMIYLRGLRGLLEYLSNGHDIEPLYVGKIGLQHVPAIQELRRRGIVTAPRILPRFLDDKIVLDRLEAVRGKSVLNLLETD